MYAFSLFIHVFIYLFLLINFSIAKLPFVYQVACFYFMYTYFLLDFFLLFKYRIT